MPIQARRHAALASRPDSTFLSMLCSACRVAAPESVVQRSWASGAALQTPSRAWAAPHAAAPSAICEAPKAGAAPSQHSLAQVRPHAWALHCSHGMDTYNAMDHVGLCVLWAGVSARQRNLQACGPSSMCSAQGPGVVAWPGCGAIAYEHGMLRA